MGGECNCLLLALQLAMGRRHHLVAATLVFAPAEFIMFCRSGASSERQPDQQSTVPRNIPYVYFWAILGMQNCEKMPHTATGMALCSEFSFLQILYDTFFSFQTFPCETLGILAAGMATTFCTRPSLKQQPSNQKKQDNIKPHFEPSHWLDRHGFLSSKFDTHICVRPDIWFSQLVCQ